MARRAAYVSSRPLRSPRKAFKPSKRFMSGLKVSSKPAATPKTRVTFRKSAAERAFDARMKQSQNEHLASTISSKGNPAKFGEAMSGKSSSGELATQIKRGPRMANVSVKTSLGLNPGAMMSPKATALATKVLPRLYGWGPSKAGKMQQHAGSAESASGNMRHKNYFIDCNFSGFRSPEFQKTLDKYKHATKHLQPFTLSPADQGKAYWNASPNTKSLVTYNNMPSVDATGWRNFYGGGGTAHAQPTVFPFSWSALDEEAITAMDPNRPDWATATAMSGNRDVNYPVVSRHMRYMFQNSNAYLPLKIKIYLLRVKSLVTLPQQPTTAWVGASGAGTQSPGCMDVDQYIRQVTDSTLYTGTWIKERAVTLGAFPGLSKVFKEMFYIENVYQQTLEPSDTLQFNMNFDSSSPLNLSDVVSMKKNILNKSYSMHCPYTIMVEFQGAQPCTLVPTIAGAAQQNLTRLMETGPARLRMVWEKSATLAFPSYAQTYSTTPERGNLEPISNMPQENRAYSVKSLNTTYDYDSMNDQTTGWEIPVVTNQDIKYSTPISRMV